MFKPDEDTDTARAEILVKYNYYNSSSGWVTITKTYNGSWLKQSNIDQWYEVYIETTLPSNLTLVVVKMHFKGIANPQDNITGFIDNANMHLIETETSTKTPNLTELYMYIILVLSISVALILLGVKVKNIRKENVKNPSSRK